MFAYKTISSIDENGQIIVKDLPFRNKENVEIILLVPDAQKQKHNIKKMKERLRASFGSIESEVVLSAESLQRENLYNDSGR